MYPDYESFSRVVYLEFLAFALFVSGISGVAASIVLKLGIRSAAVVRDAFLGGTMSLATVYVLGHLGFACSFITAVIVAILLPALFELYRSKSASNVAR